MKIEKLIWVFEKLIPVYQQAIRNNWRYNKLEENNLHWGLCYCSEKRLNVIIEQSVKRYYWNYIKMHNGYLFPIPDFLKYKEALQQRLDFMKSEIPELKELIKQGYTHI